MKLSLFINKLLAPLGVAVTRRETLSTPKMNQLAESNVDFDNGFRQLLRNQISTKWSTVDFLLRTAPLNTNTNLCPLCGFKGYSVSFGQLRSHCIFGGGDLMRHVCPDCELVFGPDKMFKLTAAELSEEYNWHYQAYDEGDSTESELRAFYALKPERNGIYLNYGAGGWSRSVNILRSEGWNVFAFEPHSAALKTATNEWFISSPDQLRHMRFDGIFSNNVLEHFRNPVEELKAMVQMLVADGKMAHATPCFEYLYEYTRFHLFFFPGKSKGLLFKNSNLELVEEVKDGDFICCVMKPNCV